MTGPVQATPDAMNRCAGFLETSMGVVRGILDSVTTANSELGMVWNGQSSNTYMNAMQVWYKEMNDILRAMGWLQDNMTQGGRYYADTEDSVQQAIGQLNGEVHTTGLTGSFFKSS